jgi:cytoskeletal protein CcmA (bactofilin family)
MFRKPLIRILASATVLTVLIFSIATPALAFDGRSGETVTIAAGEVVNDDLYLTAQTVVVNGTIKGDLIAFAQTITVNGTVEGDLMAAGQAVIINGTVKDDVRIAGAALLIGEKAKIGSDLIGAGASLEIRKGSSIGQDVVFAGGQALLAGDITRNVTVASGSLELRSAVGGNVKADVGSADQGHSSGPATFMPDTGVTIPSVKSGLTIDPAAKIGGTLEYTSAKQLSIPSGVVAGKVTYTEPKIDEGTPKPLTMTERLVNGGLDIVRTIITLILFGLLLLWLFPSFIRTTTERIKAAPLPSLGWGVVNVAAFFFALLVLFVAMLVGGIAFGLLTLNGISGAIVFFSLLSIFALIVGFALAIWFVAQIIVSILGGQLILARIKPELAENKYWPLVIGVLIYAILVAIPIFGSLIWWGVVLLGLGALWHFGREMLAKKPAVV